jgi:hypothetical protein
VVWGRMNPRSCLFAWLVIFIGLTSCSGTETWLPRIGGQPTLFQPPAQAPDARSLVQHTPTPEPIPAEIVEVPTPACSNILTFLEDVSIPDGSLARPGEALDKRWLVQNNGSCNWNEQFRLKLVSGPAMGVPAEQALYPARSGTQAILRILFSAPEELGVARSAWQAFSPQGEAFGDPFFIEVYVESSIP